MRTELHGNDTYTAAGEIPDPLAIPISEDEAIYSCLRVRLDPAYFPVNEELFS